jgi:hypothetical protein
LKDIRLGDGDESTSLYTVRDEKKTGFAQSWNAMQCNVSKSQSVEAISNATLLKSQLLVSSNERSITAAQCIALLDPIYAGLFRAKISIIVYLVPSYSQFHRERSTIHVSSPRTRTHCDNSR